MLLKYFKNVVSRRIAQLFTHREVEAIIDRKDKFKRYVYEAENLIDLRNVFILIMALLKLMR